MKTITKTFYQTTDGQEFEKRDDAEHHERVLAIDELLNAADMYFSREGVQSEEIAQWIVANMTQLSIVMTKGYI